jgi:hypothetical protein
MDKIYRFNTYILDREIRSLNESPNYTGYGASNDTVLNTAYSLNGGGYKWGGNTGVPTDIVFKGKTILDKGAGGKTHCSGFTFWTLINAADRLGLLKDKTSSQIQKLQKECFGGGEKGSDIWWKQGQEATKNLGIGFPVEFKDAKSGDFAQIWRKDGSGHSVIFIDWVKEGDNIVGIKYRGSQPSTDGIGDRTEYTKGERGIDLNHVYLWRLNPGDASGSSGATNLKVSPELSITQMGGDDTSKIYKEPKGDPYEYKVVNGLWWTRGKMIKDWKCLQMNRKANEILDARYPGVRTRAEIEANNLLYPKDEITQTEFKKELAGNDPVLSFVPVTVGADPEKEDPKLSKEFNIHVIPDNLAGTNPNYRSAQLPEKEMEYFIKKYGIKNVIRFNGDDNDSRHGKKHTKFSIEGEKQLCKSLGVNFQKLSSTRNQDEVNKILKQGSTLIHCAHGADRTGGNVGGYLYSLGWGDTKKVWDYTTQYNGWERMVKNNPSTFVNGGFLKQAQKFGVRDLEHAEELSK